MAKRPTKPRRKGARKQRKSGRARAFEKVLAGGNTAQTLTFKQWVSLTTWKGGLSRTAKTARERKIRRAITREKYERKRRARKRGPLAIYDRLLAERRDKVKGAPPSRREAIRDSYGIGFRSFDGAELNYSFDSFRRYAQGAARQYGGSFGTPGPAPDEGGSDPEEGPEDLEAYGEWELYYVPED